MFQTPIQAQFQNIREEVMNICHDLESVTINSNNATITEFLTKLVESLHVQCSRIVDAIDEFNNNILSAPHILWWYVNVLHEFKMFIDPLPLNNPPLPTSTLIYDKRVDSLIEMLIDFTINVLRSFNPNANSLEDALKDLEFYLDHLRNMREQVIGLERHLLNDIITLIEYARNSNDVRRILMSTAHAYHKYMLLDVISDDADVFGKIRDTIMFIIAIIADIIVILTQKH